MCVWRICVLVGEASYEPPEFRGVCVECDCAEKWFPCSLLFVLDNIVYFMVHCLYMVDDIRCRELVSEVVPCALCSVESFV